MPVTPRPVAKPRYEQMVERFGLTTTEHLTCACHVHVSVESDAEAVGVLDRIRVWLPTLLAISANSPFWQGQDSGYASFRSQAMARWPSAGPTEVFGSAPAYRKMVSDMVASGVLLDEGMVYFDARASHRYPTVEVRVADVCLDPRDAVLVAALCRGLVETAGQEWAAGLDPPTVPAAMLRLASWQAGREGLDGDLLDPVTHRPRPAGTSWPTSSSTSVPRCEIPVTRRWWSTGSNGCRLGATVRGANAPRCTGRGTSWTSSPTSRGSPPARRARPDRVSSQRPP
jgi:carboxylate-amine ligase